MHKPKTKSKSRAGHPPASIHEWQPSPAQLAAHFKRQEKTDDAKTVALPGPLREAFASIPDHLLGLQLFPVTAGHIAVLQSIESPFLTAIQMAGRIARAKTKKEKRALAKLAASVSNTIEDTAEVLYIFTRNPRDSRAHLAKGRQAIRAAALALLDTLPPITNWDDIKIAIGAHYSKSFVTAIHYERRSDDTVFTPPGPTMTASAGS